MLESTPLSYLKEASVFNPCLLAVFLIETALNNALSIKIFFVLFDTPESNPPKTPAKHISFSPLQIITSSTCSFLSIPSNVMKEVSFFGDLIFIISPDILSKSNA